MFDSPAEVSVYENASSLEKTAASQVIGALSEALAGKNDPFGPVHWVVTGGGVGIGTLREMASHPDLSNLDWSRVHIWWGDERFLPDQDSERNETQARAALLDALVDSGALPERNIHPIPARDGQQFKTPGRAAATYAQELARYSSADALFPRFDLLLLGMGPDGHVASLFPGDSALHAAGVAAVAVEDAPKPPPERVSLTFEAIQGAALVWVVAAGSEKAPAIRLANEGAEVDEIPMVGARGRKQTRWMLDSGSAAGLEKPANR